MSILATLAMTLGPKVIAEVAPDLLGGLMAGKGETAQKIVRVATQVALQETGLASTTPPDEVMAALKADPEAFAHVQETIRSARQMELEHEAQMQSIAAQDRDSARQLRSVRDSAARLQLVWIAVALNVVIMAAILLVAYLALPNSELLLTMLGASQGASLMMLKQAYDYWLGTSNGSDRKNDMLAPKIVEDNK